MFIRKEGLLAQREYVVNSIPLGAIMTMAVEGKLRKRLVVVVDGHRISGIPRHEFEVSDPYHWMNMIQNEIDAENARDAQPPRPTYIREVVREIVRYPCPYCSSLIDVTSDHCIFCGAPQKR